MTTSCAGIAIVPPRVMINDCVTIIPNCAMLSPNAAWYVTTMTKFNQQRGYLVFLRNSPRKKMIFHFKMADYF